MGFAFTRQRVICPTYFHSRFPTFDLLETFSNALCLHLSLSLWLQAGIHANDPGAETQKRYPIEEDTSKRIVSHRPPNPFHTSYAF